MVRGSTTPRNAPPAKRTKLDNNIAEVSLSLEEERYYASRLFHYFSFTFDRPVALATLADDLGVSESIAAHVVSNCRALEMEGGAVAVTSLICLAHNTKEGCAEPGCRLFHLCMDLVLDSGFKGRGTEYGTSLTTPKNQRALFYYGMDRLEHSVVMNILRASLPLVPLPVLCPNYGEFMCWKADECEDLHLCPDFVLGRCTSDPCKLNHKLSEDPAMRKRFLEAGFSFDDCASDISANLRAMLGDVQPRKKPRRYSVLIESDGSSKVEKLCVAGIEEPCMDVDCLKLHGPTTAAWQWKDGTRWLNLPSAVSKEIEAVYCRFGKFWDWQDITVAKESVDTSAYKKFSSRYSAKNHEYKLRVQLQEPEYKIEREGGRKEDFYVLRRVAGPSWIEEGYDDKYLTVYQWYFHELQWKPFDHIVDGVTSEHLERLYHDPEFSGLFEFERHDKKCSFDMQKLRETNKSTFQVNDKFGCPSLRYVIRRPRDPNFTEEQQEELLASERKKEEARKESEKSGTEEKTEAKAGADSESKMEDEDD